jgi:hypothetical protein
MLLLWCITKIIPIIWGRGSVFLWRDDQRNDGLPFKKEKSMPLTSKHDYSLVGNGDGDKNRGHRDSIGAHAFGEGGSFFGW